jgi:transposase-like protein
MVEETKRRGASVADVAQRHGVNANLLFGWRRLYPQGVLIEETPSGKATLLPVKVSTPTLMPSEREVGDGQDPGEGGAQRIDRDRVCRRRADSSPPEHHAKRKSR